LVYNNYPWPESVSEKQRAAVAATAQKVLAVRAEYLGVAADVSRRKLPSHALKTSQHGLTSAATPTKTATLADLYDPLATPPALQKAHEELDRAVDKCYRPEPFTSERQRVEFLFALYEKLTAPLIAAAKPKRAKKTKGLYSQKQPQLTDGKNTSPTEAAEAAFYNIMAKEEGTPYRAEKNASPSVIATVTKLNDAKRNS
jgi:hypothetical protein